MPLKSSPASTPQARSSLGEGSLGGGGWLEKIFPNSSFDFRHMGQMADEGICGDEEFGDDDGRSLFRSLMCRPIGDGQCQTRPKSSTSCRIGANAAVAGESGVVTSSSARLRSRAASLVEEVGRAIGNMVMPSRSTARDVAGMGVLKSNEVEGYCASGREVPGDGSGGDGLASVPACKHEMEFLRKWGGVGPTIDVSHSIPAKTSCRCAYQHSHPWACSPGALVLIHLLKLKWRAPSSQTSPRR